MNSLSPIRSFPLKKNPINLSLIRLIHYKQTHIQPTPFITMHLESYLMLHIVQSLHIPECMFTLGKSKAIQRIQRFNNSDSKSHYLYIYIQDIILTHGCGVTRSASARFRVGDRFKSRPNTAS